MESKLNLLDMTIEELWDKLASAGQEKYRARQIFQWVNRGVGNIDDMTNLPKDLRGAMKDIFCLGSLSIRKKLVSDIDGTTKYVLGLNDGNVLESVLMEYKHGLTACISSQAGCKMGCKFCASTGIGFVRNLSAGEILGQVISMQKDAGRRIGNIVIMGVGEPLDNFENVVKFFKLVNHKDGLNIGYRHISVSTCGLVPEILRLSEEKLPITLSVSLHAPTDEIREKIMPINKVYSIDKLIEACKIYTEATDRRVTFEYAMIARVNDSKQNAVELAKRLKGMLCHVNLIPINPVDGTGFKKSSRPQIEMFKNILEKFGIETTVRRELGGDISAACGQLRRNIIKDKV